MSNYAVDKGIEMDPKGRSGVLYPWRQMTPGASFFVPLNDVKHLRSSIYNSGRAALAAMGLTREAGYTVVVRKVTEDGVVGFRSWVAKA